MRWAVVWGVVFGLTVFSTLKAFLVGYPTLEERRQLAQTLQSFALLLGLPRHAETAPGFTSWRLLVALNIIGAVWGLLTSTGLLRGEEEAGRWELLLAGRTTKRRATAEALLGFGLALGAMFVLTALITLAVGRTPGAHFSLGGSLVFAVGLVSGAAMFLAIGSLTSQLSATRAQAASLAAAVLGGAYVVRMLADSQTSLGWLRWISPLGWLEELHPLQDPQFVALAPIAGLISACAGLTIFLAGRRDLNASVLREGDIQAHATRWLIGPTSLGLRVSRGTALGWLTGIVAVALIQGSVARSAASILSSSPTFTAALGRLGVRRAAEGYLGLSFFFVAALIAVCAAGQVAAIRDEEATGRLDNLLVRPVRRRTWLAGRFGIALGLVLVEGLLAGACTWLGASSQHTGEPLAKLVVAGLNATVPSIFILGAGACVLGCRPRLSAAATYAIVAWSFLVGLLGTVLKGMDWLRDTSLFTHMALAPAADPDWGKAAIIVALAIGLAVLGAMAFQQRDIEYA